MRLNLGFEAVELLRFLLIRVFCDGESFVQPGERDADGDGVGFHLARPGARPDGAPQVFAALHHVANARRHSPFHQFEVLLVAQLVRKNTTMSASQRHGGVDVKV